MQDFKVNKKKEYIRNVVCRLRCDKQSLALWLEYVDENVPYSQPQLVMN